MENRAVVVHTLEEATSQDPSRIARAEEEMRSLETVPNYYATLFDIFVDRSMPMQVRWLAIISLKNGIDKYWKKTDMYRIRLEEKELVRACLLSMFDEENPQIAVQYCLTISRIARWEFPRVWPEFAETLLAHVQAIVSDTESPASRRSVMEHNVLYALHLFIKTLCQRTLPLDRQALRRITPAVFATVAPIYAERLRLFQEALEMSHQLSFSDTQMLLKSIRLCLKTLRRLLVFGYAKIEEADAIAQDFYLASSTHQAVFYDLYKALSVDQRESPEATTLKKIVLIYGKMYMDFQNSHAVRFIITPGLKKMLDWYWMQVREEAPKFMPSLKTFDLDNIPALTLEPLLIQGLTLYKNVVKNFFYTPDDNGNMDDEVKQCRQVIDSEIITPEMTAQMTEVLMRCYIPLKAKDLAMWQDDPEAWVAEENSDYWSFDVRRCAEHLFVDLVNQKRSFIVPRLVQELKQGDTVSDPSLAFCQREGRYAALGLCAKELYDEFDFCKWLKEHPAVNSPMGVVKWRIAWLIGKWIPVKFPVEERPHAYTMLLELARPEEPLIVRIEALASLLCCIEDWDFDAELFSPFLRLSFERITSVLSHVTTADSRMRIVNFLSALVQRMQSEVVPFADAIVQMIPPLWQSAESENMYQTTILVLVTKLVEALGSQATKLQDFVAPLIAHSVDFANDAHVYLMEDGIELWLILIRNSTTLSDSVSALAQRLPQLLQYSTEMLKRILKVVESYFLIDPVRVFQLNGAAIFEALHNLVADTELAAKATLVGYNTLAVVVQCMPMDLCRIALSESNLLWTAFTRIVDKNDPAVVLSCHSSFLSRVSVSYPSLFIEFLASQDLGLSSTFCEHWVELYEDIAQITLRRLHAFSLAVAIATTNNGVLGALPQMVPIWNEVISDTGSSTLYYSDSEGEFIDNYEEPIMAENGRRNKLLASDPVHRLDIKQVLTQSMSECERLNGPERFQAMLARVNVEQLEQLKNQLS
ncbi:hypothetical protein GGI25_002730 [Coemansia spiralis]|uniref:Importin N-terminal domain-containing protein n=2 Tax=Coemansia TaxID=4863 RepID=A0A9W8KYQ6_9FUNG|nr:hypothetical protein EDC05_002149 [Coemansia umbellata]KAJ2625234.1 hypothetical protein GGI26_000704 [Coemansia sp. RSA 1358]KAJ2677940.1 hypothetical protein GGI25_002730 [Coemansia spiralis]